MISWLKIALEVLNLVEMLLDKARTARDTQAGTDAEIARSAARILQKTEFGKHALEEFRANPGAADEFLRSLEPKPDSH
jgi:hypothetical protein